MSNVSALPGGEVPSEDQLLDDLIKRLDRAALLSASAPSRVLRTLYGQASAVIKQLRAQVPEGSHRDYTEFSSDFTQKRRVTRVTGSWESLPPDETSRLIALDKKMHGES